MYGAAIVIALHSSYCAIPNPSRLLWTANAGSLMSCTSQLLLTVKLIAGSTVLECLAWRCCRHASLRSLVQAFPRSPFGEGAKDGTPSVFVVPGRSKPCATTTRSLQEV